mmetsp:Transcript_22693/g.33507  ORF Transcript_22693/g.33507 Transcript_22693/m.33507 type:complete len:807 (-) Transcript_22693:66-2486(-)
MRSVQTASVFLRDYEAGRPPTLPVNLESITPSILEIHEIKYSASWRYMRRLATASLFLSSCLWDDNELIVTLILPAMLNIFSVIVFITDIMLQRKLLIPMRKWTMPLIFLLAALSIEMPIRCIMGNQGRFLISSAAKPIALFYLSSKANYAFEALRRILPVVMRVLALELFLILAFSAVACRLFTQFESFQNLTTSWLSLFQLSTTVVNPKLWMPMYSKYQSSAFFFVTYETIAALYLHSLVLSVVFQSFIQAKTEINANSMTEREETIRLSFEALQDPDREDSMVETQEIRKTLSLLRPHYNNMKITALMDIVNPAGCEVIDYPTFRMRIRKALNTSIRAASTRNTFAYLLEIIAGLLAATNVFYVIFWSLLYDMMWSDSIAYPAGVAITFLGVFELAARINPFNFYNFVPITRPNATFDGLACVAALVSCWGMFQNQYRLQLMLTGRAIDMVRIMRFQRIFRDIVKRSGDVIPALVGPIALVITAQHLFVYLGMALWGGAIEFGEHDDVIEPLYDLNNFNSYLEGIVTMFQVLVINDWHEIAEVYLHATRNASPLIVYPFFIGANLISVNIMLNCTIAFFVAAFAAKLDQREFTIDGSSRSMQKLSSYQHCSVLECGSENSLIEKCKAKVINAINDSARNVSPSLSFGDECTGENPMINSMTSWLSENSHPHDYYEFEVYERQGFDNIMKTVAGSKDDTEACIKEVCNLIETIEHLGQVKLDYMIYCEQTTSRIGNQGFQKLSMEFMTLDEMYSIVTEMHAQLLPQKNNRSLIRNFEERSRVLQISASLVREYPSISMFVLRTT